MKKQQCITTLKQDTAVVCLHFVNEKLAVGTRRKLKIMNFNERETEEDKAKNAPSYF